MKEATFDYKIVIGGEVVREGSIPLKESLTTDDVYVPLDIHFLADGADEGAGTED